MLMSYPRMKAVRSGGALRKVDGFEMYVKDIVCLDGCVMSRLTA